MEKPNDRLKKNGKTGDMPKILASAEIKIPDKEVHIMQPDEKAPEGGGICACHSVCTCVPVATCACDMVCSCDSVCSTNISPCYTVYGCPEHICNCQPVCRCYINCLCLIIDYWYPN